MKKIILIMFGMILLIGIVSAYDIVENAGTLGMTEVNYTYPNGVNTVSSFEPFELFCKGRFSTTSLGTKESEELKEVECTKEDYYKYINSEMDSKPIPEPSIIPDTTKETYEGENADNWFVSWVKNIFNSLFGRVDKLEEENQQMKKALCEIKPELELCKT